MKTNFGLFVFLAGMGVVVVIFNKLLTLKKIDAPWPFYLKKPLSQPEQILYYRIVSAMPEYIVLAQVQLSRILGVKRGFKFHEWNNRINRMSLDFVVCHKDSTVVAAIELDDKTHERPSRIKADKKKEKALSAAGVSLHRWNVSSLPDEKAIRLALVTPLDFSSE